MTPKSKTRKKVDRSVSGIVVANDNTDIHKEIIHYRCKWCKHTVNKIKNFQEGECPDNHQHEFRPIYKSLVVNMPFWVLIDLVHEKRGWESDCDGREEKLPEYERWILDELSIAADLVVKERNNHDK